MSCGQLALQRAGIKVDNYIASEVDKYAIKVTQHNFPDTIQVGSVTEITGDMMPLIDLLIGGSPCFVAGTKVITNKGYKNIEDIIVGDMCLTHTGSYKPVIATGNEVKPTVLLKSQGIKPTETTFEHPYYVRQMKRGWAKGKRCRLFSGPIWKKAGELHKDDFIGLPIITEEINPLQLSKEDCWLIGRYIADGHLRKTKRPGRKNSYQYQVVYSIGSHKLDDFKSNVKRLFSCYPHSQSVHRCVLSSKQFLELLTLLDVGTDAYNKKIPHQILQLPKHLAKCVLDGYMSGDGSKRKAECRATSVSEELILGLNLLIAKVYNVNSGYEFCDRPKKTVIEGRIVNQKNTFSTSFRKEMCKQSKAVVIDNVIWLPVKSITPTLQKEIVYNIAVSEDNSYTANNAIVHNCQGFSVAGKGLNFDDPRSKLFFEYVRLLKELRVENPNIKFLLENVKMKKEWEDVITEYLGVKPILINSALVSAQNRKRLYWTNIEGVQQPEDRFIFLKDILENGIVDKNKSFSLTATYSKGGSVKEYFNHSKRQIVFNIDDSKTHKIGCINPNALQSKRIYTVESKSPTLSASGTSRDVKIIDIDNINAISKVEILEMIKNGDLVVRKLTPIECERLQTLPDNYSACVSNAQRYKMCGNGWNVDTIAHILSYLK